MRLVYTFLLYLLLPLIVLRLYWNSRQVPAYRHRWRERFGLGLLPVETSTLWVHAVSVGEVLGSAPLIQKLLDYYPQRQVVVTTMTPTGSERVKNLFGDRVQHCYAPYDLPTAVRRFFSAKRPCLLVLFETEIWPNLIHLCYQQDIPVLLINARMSASSARGYGRFRALTQTLLRKLSFIAAQSAADAERFIALGADTNKMQITGSVKFDLTLTEEIKTEARILRNQWSGRPCLIAASTHQGEEENVLLAFRKIKQAHPGALLILVPRHPQRFDRVAEEVKSSGFSLIRRSQMQAPSAQHDVFLIDTMGELLMFYACADVAFVGGSLVPQGGHNVLEPAAWGLPVLSGPHLFNFQTISDLLVTAGGLQLVKDSDALATQVIQLFSCPEQAKAMGQKAEAVVRQNRGALAKQLQLIQNFL